MNDSLFEITIDSYEQHILFAALNNHIDNVLNGTYALGNSENLQHTNEVLQQAWNKVKERHKDTLQRMSNK
mgnify:FL=1